MQTICTLIHTAPTATPQHATIVQPVSQRVLAPSHARFEELGGLHAPTAFNPPLTLPLSTWLRPSLGVLAMLFLAAL